MLLALDITTCVLHRFLNALEYVAEVIMTDDLPRVRGGRKEAAVPIDNFVRAIEKRLEIFHRDAKLLLDQATLRGHARVPMRGNVVPVAQERLYFRI